MGAHVLIFQSRSAQETERIAAELATLPLLAAQSSSGTTTHTVSRHLVLPPQRLVKITSKPMHMAKASFTVQGLVLHYVTLNSSLSIFKLSFNKLFNCFGVHG